jgi:flagellar biosynthesis GTPase FlhF
VTTPSSTPEPVAPTPKSGGKNTRVWMIVAGVAIVAAIGFGIWAAKSHSDLNNAESQLQAQNDAAAAAAAQAEKIAADNSVYVVSDEDAAKAESEVAAAEKALSDATNAANDAAAAAQDEASKLRAELDQAQAERDLARAERDQARVCSRGALGTITSLGKDEDTSELETVSSDCTAAVSSG